MIDFYEKNHDFYQPYFTATHSSPKFLVTLWDCNTFQLNILLFILLGRVVVDVSHTHNGTSELQPMNVLAHNHTIPVKPHPYPHPA